MNILKRFFGSRNDRVLSSMYKLVHNINKLENSIAVLHDNALKAKTTDFKERLIRGETLEMLLPEAFAVVREASKRVLEMRHFDVQLIGGIVLHTGKIAEMRTGEGKTLVATLPVYLNALTGKGVHVVTVNDYLAKRDAEWMGQLYCFLGMTVGTVTTGMDQSEKLTAYAADITYGTNNEYGFDYLRDNMTFSTEHKVQRSLNYALVDEVDSILIDEARTPLIISGPAEESSELYRKINNIIPLLNRQKDKDGSGDYWVDEKAKQVYLSETGHQRVENLLVESSILVEDTSLYDPVNLSVFHHVNACLRAHALFHKNIDYIVRTNEVVIVDEFTGRTMLGRRWSDGLHQAIEAKEGLFIQPENQTLASITFQNYFRLYHKIAGMTGTADTEASEFQQIYGLEVVVIPTHLPMIRRDMGDLVFLTKQEKFDAVLADICVCYKRGQPTLVGTTSIEVSELLSKMLDKEKIPHQVLNAKQHDREADIIAQAGQPGSVTIATNMAGRGTDIVLGGNLQAELKMLSKTIEPELIEVKKKNWSIQHKLVVNAGGLHVIGTERHESRRIDNQLRGRSGRQGDPGSSRFYLSLEDNLLRIFASEKLANLMQKLGMDKNEAIEHPWVTKAIENAQRKVEAYNFDIRKNLLEFDDVTNDQRKVIYSWRNEIIESKEEIANDMITMVINQVIDRFIQSNLAQDDEIAGLESTLLKDFNLSLPLHTWLQQHNDISHLRQMIQDTVLHSAAEKKAQIGESITSKFEKTILLQVLDTHWREHLAAMDYVRQGIHLRGYAQKNPKQEYKREAFEMFQIMVKRIHYDYVSFILKNDFQHMQLPQQLADERSFNHPEVVLHEHDNKEYSKQPVPFIRNNRKVGRNEPCPCGSQKKYKHCHGQLN